MRASLRLDQTDAKGSRHGLGARQGNADRVDLEARLGYRVKVFERWAAGRESRSELMNHHMIRGIIHRRGLFAPDGSGGDIKVGRHVP